MYTAKPEQLPSQKKFDALKEEWAGERRRLRTYIEALPASTTTTSLTTESPFYFR